MYDVVLFTDVCDHLTAMPPLGAYKCAHILRRHGYSCLVVDYFSDYDLVQTQKLLQMSVGANTKLVGFSISFFLNKENYVEDRLKPTPVFPSLKSGQFCPQGLLFQTEMLSYIKELAPESAIAVGGHGVTLNWSNKQVDYAVIGYSESSIVAVVNYLKSGKAPLNAKKNLYGVTVIDDRTAENYDFSKDTMEWIDTDIVNRLCLPLEIARGCVFKCKFCSYPMNGKKQMDFVKSSVSIANELQRNWDLYGIKHYMIVDDTFNDNNYKLEQLHRTIKQLNFQPIFWAYVRWDLLSRNPHTIAMLNDMGVRNLHMGIETLHAKSAKAVGKTTDIAKLIASLTDIRTNYPDMSTFASFIIGLPYESEKSVLDTSDKLLRQEIPVDAWQFYALQLQKPYHQNFSDSISQQLDRFGYQTLDDLPQYPQMINWKNQFTTYTKAIELSNNLNALATAQQTVSVPFFSQMATMGVNCDIMRHNLERHIDFSHIQYEMRPRFVKQYQTQLNHMLAQREIYPERL